ncbi:MAG: sensor histidine kinase [Microbacteriaceae bacterium]|nr:sensor histidine kinase [Microbacteriaceae bacterium]
MFRRLTPVQYAVDVAVPLLLVLFGLWITRDSLGGMLVTVGMGLALVPRRFSPGLALAIAWAVSLAQVAVDVPPQVSNLAILAILYATAAYGTRVVRWLGFASTFVGATVITLSVVLPELVEQLVGRDLSALLSVPGAFGGVVIVFVAALVAFLLSWTAGLLWSTIRRARANRRDALAAEQEIAAEQERTRIARDMHDVVAHSLAVVVAQADGARYIAQKDPQATEEALVTISSTAREALADVRLLLAQLRHAQGDGPQPTLVDLDRLFEQVRTAGLDIEREQSGSPLALGTAPQLAVYRIVQESLTNALRHADTARPVRVRFDWTPHGLDLTIASALRAPTGRTGAIRTGATSTGHGVAGMTERALLAGGRLTAGPVDGSFVVRAWLPAHPTVPADPAPVEATA